MGAGDQYAPVDSWRNQATVPIIILPVGALLFIACITAAVWLASHGPVPVPAQDTRVMAGLISIFSRLSSLVLGAAMMRSAWASFVPDVLAGELIPTQTLICVCRNFLSIGQLRNYGSLPKSFKYHVILAVFTSLAMTGTSASFKYESLAQFGRNVASVADTAHMCNPNMVISGSFIPGYPCGNDINSNSTTFAWDYIEEVAAGGRGTVLRQGRVGVDRELSANVTLAALPPGWSMGNESNLPWMAMSVTCENLPISAEFNGTGLTAMAYIYVNGATYVLDIANMPAQNSIVHLFQQFNDSGPVSNLSPWIAVMLEMDKGSAKQLLSGVSRESLTRLGPATLDFGYEVLPIYILGAATMCRLRGSTGGQWPEILWPSQNNSNIFFGTTVGGKPTMGTVILNYGPGWQWSVVGDNWIPGGSVSYIANYSGPDVSFSDLFSSYPECQEGIPRELRVITCGRRSVSTTKN